MPRTLLKVVAIAVLAVAHLSQPTTAGAAGASQMWCGTCMGDCPSPWEYDAICHAICSQQSMGWCPGPNELCGPWSERLMCQGDPM